MGGCGEGKLFAIETFLGRGGYGYGLGAYV